MAAFTSAPASIRRSATARRPSKLASWSGVSPLRVGDAGIDAGLEGPLDQPEEPGLRGRVEHAAPLLREADIGPALEEELADGVSSHERGLGEGGPGAAVGRLLDVGAGVEEERDGRGIIARAVAHEGVKEHREIADDGVRVGPLIEEGFHLVEIARLERAHERLRGRPLLLRHGRTIAWRPRALAKKPAYGLFRRRSLYFTRTGTPSNPNVCRIWFSTYRR
jgi:hypothetical protein